MDKVNIA
jgi:mannose-6-phosphate isomerase-like protein (cupin superfamily)